MDIHSKHIIWGATLKGVQKAIELRQQGEQHLLLNQYGFPGGRHTESLSALFFKENNPDLEWLLREMNNQGVLSRAILFENTQFVLLHPEMIKRCLWSLIREYDIPVLFHLNLVETDQEGGSKYLEVFGREGSFRLWHENFYFLLDTPFFPGGAQQNAAEPFCESGNMLINCFFDQRFPLNLPGHNLIWRLETQYGFFACISERFSRAEEVFHLFNNRLDSMATLIWKEFGSRLLLVPVCPEIRPWKNGAFSCVHNF